MIKIDAKKRTIRETTCPFHYSENGELKSEEIRVRYYSFTWNEIQAEHARIAELIKNDPLATVWPNETLAERIAELPDLQDAKGKPFVISAKTLGDLDTKNLDAIKKAIDEDLSGK
mgnify:CR=1 FL=1